MDNDVSQQLSANSTTPQQEAWHQNQERKKYDIIRVANPTDEDFFVKYDINRYQKVPANGTTDIPRYIAERYVVHMKDAIINQKNKELHDAHLAKRRLAGMPEYQDDYTRNLETYMTSPYPRTNDPVVMADIFDKLWVGLVMEFGKDSPPPTEMPKNTHLDRDKTETKLIEGLFKKKVSVDDQVNMPQPQKSSGATAFAMNPDMFKAPVEATAPESFFAGIKEKLGE